ncbi:glycosyltransferase family 2 protein [aff. Roholtiella sp. LEGE 12411]|uniref:glycosyltransferase family 2 protein n=1 Tax=aff. Roholtiella sp. LEGE 12411 TaxID=1828822 RepID=UPI00187EA90A|nr:glycosyltransferase family A protein [aff. Roholtiella sp. LEGE 12411]MBE9034143.1 glycosyltransferase family 2 protein [aff. Roholtiella sp. LEGE 12411]
MIDDELMLSVSSDESFDINFKDVFVSNFLQSPSDKVALLVTNEYEGILGNGGIGTYYNTLSQKLSQNGWDVILLLCCAPSKIEGKSNIPHVKHIFSICELEQVLNLQPIHSAILSQLQYSNPIDYTSYCCLFFTQAVTATFKNSLVYVEFHEYCGIGYRSVQAKRANILEANCLLAVTMHGGHEWISETNKKYIENDPYVFWQICYYEQYSFENADLAFFTSYQLKSKVESYGWKTSHSLYLPYSTPILENIEKLEIPEKSSLFQINEQFKLHQIKYLEELVVKSSPQTDTLPKVTIGVTCYNLGKYLLDCLNSLNVQTYKNLEIIVLDDASTDEHTQEVINQAQLMFPNFKFIKSNINIGLGAARNYLVEIAQGDYFIPFDADNIALPFMVEKYVKAALSSNTAIVNSPMMAFGTHTIGVKRDTSIYSFTGGLLPTMLQENCWGDAASLFSIRILRKFKHPEDRGIVSHDWQIMVATSVTSEKIGYYTYPLYFYRLRPDSMIHSQKNHARDKYHLRRYLSQIEPSNYSHRHIYMLLTATQQLLQSQQHLQSQLHQAQVELERAKSQIADLETSNI